MNELRFNGPRSSPLGEFLQHHRGTESKLNLITLLHAVALVAAATALRAGARGRDNHLSALQQRNGTDNSGAEEAHCVENLAAASCSSLAIPCDCGSRFGCCLGLLLVEDSQPSVLPGTDSESSGSTRSGEISEVCGRGNRVGPVSVFPEPGRSAFLSEPAKRFVPSQ